MNNVELKSMVSQNYRCFHGEKEFLAEFGEKTRISGKNGSGKSTVMNAFMETLTGKNADGTQPDNVRPVVNGQELDGVDVVRSLVLDINGTETEIKKITKQKKERVDGAMQYISGSNVNSYEVDGISFTQKKFSEFIEKNICKPDMLTACCNPNTFLSIKSTTDQRAFLEDMAGFDLQAYIKSMGVEFEKVEEITKGHPIEQVQKTLNKQLTDQKKKTGQAETTWKYEKSREPEKGEAEIAELQKSVDEYNKQIAELDDQEKALNDVSSVYDEKSREIVDLRNKQNQIRTERNNVLSRNRQHIQSGIAELQSQKREKENDLRMAEMDLKHANIEVRQYESDLKKLEKAFDEWKSENFDDSELEKIKSETFDENSAICPVCHREFPEDMKNDKIQSWQADKDRRILEQEKKKNDFDVRHNERYEEIRIGGVESEKERKSAEEKANLAEQKIVAIKKSISDLALKIAEKEKELSALPAEVDLSGDTEYNVMSAQIEAAQKSLETMDNGSSARAEITEQRNAYIRESAKLAAEINKIQSDRKRREEQVEKLYAEYRESGQLEADIQRKKDILKNFSIKKNERIAEMINPNFTEFQFEFLDYMQDGTLFETCKLVRNGIEFSNLNYSDQLICKIDLLRGFQKIQGVRLPIFVDNAESINSERLPEIEQQMIVLKVSNEPLKVETF